jgi:predicted aspartyl protease
VRAICWQLLAPGLVAAGCLAASAAEPAAAEPAVAAPAAVAPDLDAPQFAIPTTSDRAGRVVAAVYIGEQGPLRFILDTGANRSALAERTVRNLGLVPGGQAMVHGITGSSVMPTVEVAKLRVGDFLMADQRLAVLPDSVFAGVDGILGIDVVQRSRVDVDFANDQVVVGRSGKRASGDRIVVPARLSRGGLLLIHGKVGRVRVKAIIDTGAERSLGNEALRKALLVREKQWLGGEATKVVGATAQVAEGYAFVAPPIALGGDANVDNLRVIFGDFHVFRIWSLLDEPALVIGMDALGTLSGFSIDYPRRQFLLKLAQPAPPPAGG